MTVRVRRYQRRPRRISQRSIVFRGEPVTPSRFSSGIGRVKGEKALIKSLRPDVAELTELVRDGFEYTVFMESAVDTLDDLLEFDVVPPTTIRVDEDGYAVVSVQEFVPNARRWGSLSREGRRGANRRDLIKIAIIDIIVHQEDRHGGNLLVTPDHHVHAIDNELALSDDPADSIAVRTMEGWKIPSDILRKMKDVQKEDFVTAFAGVTPERVEAAWTRKVELERSGRIVNL